MDVPSIVALSLGLAMDATAVSAARGASASRITAREVALVALYFGGFQAGMPLAGWALGALVRGYVAAWGHWIAFALLTLIALKMLKEARDARANDDPRPNEELFAHAVMVALAVATSIDAFAVGVTLPLLRAPMALSLTLIGLTTAASSAVGILLGRRAGAMIGRRLDFVGAIVLLALALEMLVNGLSRR
jgi:putative Mn2+ efflux pump MntP